MCVSLRKCTSMTIMYIHREIFHTLLRTRESHRPIPTVAHEGELSLPSLSPTATKKTRKKSIRTFFNLFFAGFVFLLRELSPFFLFRYFDAGRSQPSVSFDTKKGKIVPCVPAQKSDWLFCQNTAKDSASHGHQNKRSTYTKRLRPISRALRHTHIEALEGYHTVLT